MGRTAAAVVVTGAGRPLGPVILAMRARGEPFAAIAARLNTAGVPTSSGRGHWRGEQVYYYLNPDRNAARMRAYRAARRRLG